MICNTNGSDHKFEVSWIGYKLIEEKLLLLRRQVNSLKEMNVKCYKTIPFFTYGVGQVGSRIVLNTSNS